MKLKTLLNEALLLEDLYSKVLGRLRKIAINNEDEALEFFGKAENAVVIKYIENAVNSAVKAQTKARKDKYIRDLKARLVAAFEAGGSSETEVISGVKNLLNGYAKRKGKDNFSDLIDVAQNVNTKGTAQADQVVNIDKAIQKRSATDAAAGGGKAGGKADDPNWQYHKFPKFDDNPLNPLKPIKPIKPLGNLELPAPSIKKSNSNTKQKQVSTEFVANGINHPSIYKLAGKGNSTIKFKKSEGKFYIKFTNGWSKPFYADTSESKSIVKSIVKSMNNGDSNFKLKSDLELTVSPDLSSALGLKNREIITIPSSTVFNSTTIKPASSNVNDKLNNTDGKSNKSTDTTVVKTKSGDIDKSGVLQQELDVNKTNTYVYSTDGTTNGPGADKQYIYAYVNNEWLAKNKKINRWYNISWMSKNGYPQFSKSIDLLNTAKNEDKLIKL